MTPPPINEVHLEAEDQKKGYSDVTRHQSVTAKYAEAVRELAEDFRGRKVHLVDLWAALMKQGAILTPGFVEGGALLGSSQNGDSEGLRRLLIDGLHLNAKGYALFLKEVMPLVATKLEDGNANSQPWIFP